MFRTLRKPQFLKIYLIPLLATGIGSMSWSVSILYALELGADIFQINLITTIRSTMSILLVVPFGILSDRFGRRPMVLYPRIIMLVGTLIRAFALNPTHLLLAAFVGGFAGGSYFPILLSMIADIAEPQEQQESISTLFFFSSVGMVCGPLISTLLLNLPQTTLRSIYQLGAIAEALVLIYLATQIRETHPPIASDQPLGYRESIMEVLRQSSFQGLLVMAFLYFFSRAVIQTYIPIYASVDLKLSNAEVASLSIYRNFAIMLIRLSSATYLTRVSIRPYLLTVLLVGGVTCLAAPLANNYFFIILLFFLSGISFGAVMILSNTLVAKNSRPENRGVANSMLNVGQSSGNLLKILTSSIAETLGLFPVFLMGGVIGLIAIIPILLTKDERDP
ncbi:MAG: MFS transporter [Candidatus Bathyarchaeota archaeon]|nr:MFS transporter [Candidatus Bathyarchaeota archaeon]